MSRHLLQSGVAEGNLHPWKKLMGCGERRRISLRSLSEVKLLLDSASKVFRDAHCIVSRDAEK